MKEKKRFHTSFKCCGSSCRCSDDGGFSTVTDHTPARGVVLVVLCSYCSGRCTRVPQASVFSAPHHLCLPFQAHLHLQHSIMAAIRVETRKGKHAEFWHHDYEENQTLQCGSKVQSRNERWALSSSGPCLMLPMHAAFPCRRLGKVVPRPTLRLRLLSLLRIQIPSVSQRHDLISLHESCLNNTSFLLLFLLQALLPTAEEFKGLEEKCLQMARFI